VIATDKTSRIAALGFVYQRITAVLADVVERLDAVILLADHQHFLAAHGLHLPVSRFGNLSFSAQ